MTDSVGGRGGGPGAHGGPDTGPLGQPELARGRCLLERGRSHVERVGDGQPHAVVCSSWCCNRPGLWLMVRSGRKAGGE